MSQHTVTLHGETDWPGFRREAGAFLARLVAPECVNWRTRATSAVDRYVGNSQRAAHADASASGAVNMVVPRSFVSLCETVILHDDPDRFGLLYRLLWRLVHEPRLLDDPLDADRVRAQHMAQAVRRDMQRMKTLIRFHALDDGDASGPVQAAWFEPHHHIVEAIAPFFVHRLAPMRWVVFTPERSVRWNGATLESRPHDPHDEAPLPDAVEATWLAYYRRVFDPARAAACPRADLDVAQRIRRSIRLSP